MASDAHAMLRSRDFGSSGSSEEEDNNDHHAGEYQEQQRHDGDYEHVQHQYDHDSINNTTDPTTAGASASVSGAGARTASRQHYHSSDSSTSGYDVSNAQSASYIGHQTAANLASFEDSFIPPQQHEGDDEDDDVDEGLYSPGGSNRRQGQAGIGGPRPKTPSAKELQSTRQQQRRVISDAAGFTRHQGPRDIFDNRDDGGGLADISQYEDRNARNQQEPQGRQRRTASRQQQTHGDTDSNAQEEVEDDGDGTSGLNDQPSFERSESQSMRVETVNTKRGGGTAKNGAVTGSSRDADSSRHVKAGSKQQLTLREQEKLIDEVNKENFSLKLKIYFLEERLAKLTPEQMDVALKETIELKVEYQSLKQELKKHKKWLLEATNALEESRKNQDMAHGRVSRTEQEANAEISRLRAELEAEKQARVEEREDLEAQLDDALARANEREEEGEELHKNIDGLEEENAKLRSQVNAQVTMLATRNDEKEQLYDELEALKQDNLALETELQEQRDRRASNASGRETSIAELEDDLNKYRDKLSAAMLDLERREKDIAELNAELDQREAEHEEDVAKAIDEWKIALEEARQDKDQLTDALEDRERELEKMDKKLEEFDNLAREDQKKVDKALRKADEKQKEVDALGEEVMGLTDDIQKLSKQIEALEDEVDDKAARIQDLEKDLDAADRELEDRQRMHEQVVIALKEKAASNKSRQADLTIQHESLTTEVTFLRNKTEELALKCAELEESKRSDDKLRQRLQDDKYALEKRLRDKEAELQEVELHHNRQISEMESDWRTTISEKDQSLNSVRSQLRQVQDRLQVREQDLERLNEVLQNRDEQAKRQGDDHTSDRMSLILEVERLNRDLAHYEADLDHARAELDRKEDELRQRDLEAATLRATNNDISAQLALQTQSRLNLSDQLDATSKTLRQTQDDVANLRDRLHRAEKDQSGNSRSTGRANADYRDQLSERNSLLQSVYQAIDKAVGMDKKRPSQADLKPHTNFAVFHDAIMSRIRVIVQVQQLFERKAKDIEGRFVDQINSLKKQQDSRMRQLDRLELAVKNAVDSQKQWKQRILLKHNEVESVKATNGELNEQLSSLKTRVNVTDMSPGSNQKIQALAARASTAERRLKATQDQLQTVETKFAEAKNKVATAEDHWQARLKELMNKLREAEEKNKRERQGAKERVRELQQNISDLQAQIDNANSRNRKLAHVLDNQVM